MRVLVEADGGSRGNPGPAGYGAVVYDADHTTVLAERKEAIGRATNNVAEYRGLIAGLEAAAELRATDVAVSMDSKLVIEQMSGRWRVKHPDLIELQRRAAALAADFGHVSYQWIPRERNSHADRLANEAMDAAAGIAVPEKRSAVPPPSEEPEQPDRPVKTSVGWSGVTGAPTRLLLLRHGQTELSIERRYSGRGNPALTEEGRRQADAAARYLGERGGVSAVVTSPLQRAYDTAAAAAKALGLDVTVDDDLIETDFGEWEGLTFAEAAQRDPELHKRWLRDTSVEPPGGESFDAVAHRVRRARDRIIAEHGASTVLVVSHVTPIKTVLRLALDAGEGILYRLHLDLASLSIAEFYGDGGSAVRLVNQTAYL
ncbi:bifunctional RNase H/acid phosphatase [Mycolicibacterium goodii]|uniref:bifunctional RNase H/acid phosphatase n=1 Tax=Mycolicibacterium goodii TaxID=134601 RepID=UPI00093970EF|nr:bifunctional RNase H/acid phosphatase [Mycolicibacterium goodii]OKH61233.1 acid phosphatase [Mycobacterium sp. SWH-M5]ULN45614.1 bifunctional RNase H/acid phosphatase [Mycolicibacterium goodii]